MFEYFKKFLSYIGLLNQSLDEVNTTLDKAVETRAKIDQVGDKFENLKK